MGRCTHAHIYIEQASERERDREREREREGEREGERRTSLGERWRPKEGGTSESEGEVKEREGRVGGQRNVGSGSMASSVRCGDGDRVWVGPGEPGRPGETACRGASLAGFPDLPIRCRGPLGVICTRPVAHQVGAAHLNSISTRSSTRRSLAAASGSSARPPSDSHSEWRIPRSIALRCFVVDVAPHATCMPAAATGRAPGPEARRIATVSARSGLLRAANPMGSRPRAKRHFDGLGCASRDIVRASARGWLTGQGRRPPA